MTAIRASEKCDVCGLGLDSLKDSFLVLPAYRDYIVTAALGDARHRYEPIIAHSRCFDDGGTYCFELERILDAGSAATRIRGDSLYDWKLHLREKTWWRFDGALERAHKAAKKLKSEQAARNKTVTLEGRARAEKSYVAPDKLMPKTSIYIDGEDVSVVTDARDERDFSEGFAPAFGKFIALNGKNPAGAPRAVLTAAFDIIAKLRGYKSNVQERRVLAAGRWPHPNEKAIAEIASDDTPESTEA